MRSVPNVVATSPENGPARPNSVDEFALAARARVRVCSRPRTPTNRSREPEPVPRSGCPMGCDGPLSPRRELAGRVTAATGGYTRQDGEKLAYWRRCRASERIATQKDRRALVCARRTHVTGWMRRQAHSPDRRGSDQIRTDSEVPPRRQRASSRGTAANRSGFPRRDGSGFISRSDSLRSAARCSKEGAELGQRLA